ncbi:pre-RNA processing PIH1/Nop17-domain-containing protein [Phanerochaete sordida]|uniref:Pre-RNA processing PIH1/Nop17-domain-containing protein n=1 Tax=Phanerochaete sordida TaxID=48140 RepID=A0A9P3GJA1_9APHY|nr:pre-RNA processing PIH1/Nop17-domain-containing protein [Phanerochaete sordida]
MDARTVRVDLSPKPGFCIKTTTLQSATFKVSPSVDKSQTVVSDAVTIPRGMKVFVNVAWDANVPPPPEGSEEMIQKAMLGELETDEDALASGRAWFVPVIVSEPRMDSDKAGKPSVVFDSVYNPALKSRATRDAAFRTFVMELALQRIEAQHGLQLSREIGTPNIASKGKLAPRSALVPLALLPEAHALRVQADKAPKKLVEEILPSDSAVAKPDVSAPPKSILKRVANTDALQAQERPVFEWTKDGERIKITVGVPNLTHDDVANAALDVEPRRIILDVPSLYHLDVDLAMPDAQIMATFGGTSSEGSPLMLKRQRELDVDGATAEWRVQERTLILYV